MSDVITTTDLTITRDGRRLVTHLSTSVAPASSTAITGPNGSGKSTLAWCLSLHDDDYEGHITLDGVNARNLSPRDRRRLHRGGIALQPQSLLLEDAWTVERVLTHGAWAVGVSRRRRSESVAAVVDRMGLADLRRTRVGLLSGGERLRVALARTRLMTEPRLVVLDEPTAGADDELTGLVLELVADWTAQGAATVIVTHDPRLIARAGQELRLGGAPDAQARPVPATLPEHRRA
ncbi:ATP-binding cassette domain-containing protein [Actinomyces radicidentis]|uniref:ATP-binding cassette domain-containing protein n=1 Tax=Actinomyces radicidentis TaxID=111015 RepID=UPI0026DEE161|nr:ATP-binding cassette domain-containing protein [Actinomyces radicidentis]